MVCRWDCKAERVRWEGGGRGERRARAPVGEVRRRDCVLVVGAGGRRVRVEKGWPVWKVVWWRRWVPFAERGSDAGKGG